MNKIITLLCIFFSLNIAANDVFKSIELRDKNTSYLLKLMIDHLKINKVSYEQAKAAINSLKKLNDNLQPFKANDTKFFLTSEIYKSCLNYSPSQISSNDIISISLIKNIEKKLTKFKLIYSDFSKFIIYTAHQEFAPFLKKGFLDNYQNLKNLDSKEFKKANALKMALKYSGKWIHLIKSNSPQEFNEISSSLIISTLRQLADQSTLIELHAKKNKSHPKLILGLDSIEIQSFLNKETNQNNENIPDISPESAIKDLKIDPMDQVRKELDTLLSK